MPELSKSSGGKYPDNHNDLFVFEMFSVRTKRQAKPALSNSSGLKSFFEKRRFGDGLVWTNGLTGEIELVFIFLRRIVDEEA